jgi:uncharacterized protein
LPDGISIGPATTAQRGPHIGITDHYRKISDLPAELPLFPLRGVILLPRTTLPLNVFEPRYLTMINDALAGERMIGIVQPAGGTGADESPSGRDVPLHSVGGAGRITAFQETDDNRVLISLSGIARFRLGNEIASDFPYRVCEADFTPYKGDLERGLGDELVDREVLLVVLKNYLKAKGLGADWDSIDRSPNELLVNTLSMICPYGAEEKQALLEADTLKARAEVLVALAEMDLAASDTESGSTLQ